jgi:methylphosphotriester-DNA--protein-cysteine methyltransferase
MTPGEYHKKVLVEHIKEKLSDKNLSIKEAFAACGEDSQGWIAKKLFKDIAGITPKQFRESENPPKM